MNASCMSLNSVSDIAERFYFSVRTENLHAWCVRGCMCVLLNVQVRVLIDTECGPVELFEWKGGFI